MEVDPAAVALEASAVCERHLFSRPGALEQAVNASVEHYDHCRYHESPSNVTPAEVYLGRHHDILSERRKTKEETTKPRRLINHDHAA